MCQLVQPALATGLAKKCQQPIHKQTINMCPQLALPTSVSSAENMGHDSYLGDTQIKFGRYQPNVYLMNQWRAQEPFFVCVMMTTALCSVGSPGPGDPSVLASTASVI